jgi:ABC-2 type transport system permease protein
MNAFAGTGGLVRLILRRDRVVMPIWVLFIALLAISTAASFSKLYPTPEVRQAYIQEIANSPAEVAMLGFAYAPTPGALVAWRWSVQGVLIAGLASLFTVVRHTRTEEEAGRRELLGATVVGRFAPLTAALLVTFAADTALAAIVAGGLMGLGLPASGSVALGSSIAGAGWVFAALGGVTAQLTESAGTARGIGGAFVGLAYLLRALGDSGGKSGLGWLSWLSPMGWARFTRPFADERWWVFALFAGLVLVLCAAAFALLSRRDLGAGVFAPRLGPAEADPGLNSPLALAWRLQRGALVGWMVGFAVVGTVFGFVAHTVAEQLSENPQVLQFLARSGGGASPSDAFFTLYLVAFGPVFAVYAVLSALRLRSEEASGRADLLLADPVSRRQWAGSHLVVLALGSAGILAVFGITAGLTYGLSSGSLGRDLPRVLGASLAYLPAVWVLGGIAAALWGFWPRLAAPGSWALLGIFGLIELAWELQQVSRSVYNFSPFAHVPKILLNQGSILSLLGLLLVAAALAAAGLVGFGRRDMD